MQNLDQQKNFDFEKEARKVHTWLKKFFKKLDKANKRTKNSKLRFK
jgi:hypothetical protein